MVVKDYLSFYSLLPLFWWLKVCNASVFVFCCVVCVNWKDVFRITFDALKQVCTVENFTVEMIYCS